MPNHIHLLLRQRKDGGITKFMKKLGTGYAMYFNKKHNRMGHLFQGSFRAVHIKNDEQLQTVFVYIHTNPISLIIPGWKEKGVGDIEKIIKFLENYKWSSYLDYIDTKNFPSVTQRDLLFKIMGGVEGCREFVKGWLGHKRELKDFEALAIE
jgi:putative transposase